MQENILWDQSSPLHAFLSCNCPSLLEVHKKPFENTFLPNRHDCNAVDFLLIEGNTRDINNSKCYLCLCMVIQMPGDFFPEKKPTINIQHNLLLCYF